MRLDPGEKFSLNDIQGAEGIVRASHTTHKANLAEKNPDLRESFKRDPSVGARTSVDRAPIAKAIMETDHPREDLSEEIKSLPPGFKKLLQDYLADDTNRKSTSHLADAEDRSESRTTAVVEDSSPDSLHDSAAIQRSIGDISKSDEPSAVVQASTFATNDARDTTNTSHEVESPAADSLWSESLQKAVSALEKEINDNPEMPDSVRLKKEMDLRFLQLAAGKLDDASRPIAGLNSREQDYMLYQIKSLYNATNPDDIPVRRRMWSTVMESQREAVGHLAALSDLEVKSAEFCTDVDGYGLTKKFANYQFMPDQDVLLYCELENVDAESVRDGFETKLQGRYEIIDRNGQRIADQLLPMESEICKNHRRDYFIVYKIYMPMQIQPGNYQFRLTIEDMKAKKFGQILLDFQIAK